MKMDVKLRRFLVFALVVFAVGVCTPATAIAVGDEPGNPPVTDTVEPVGGYWTIDDAGALEVARRSRGTPRIANRLLKRVRDFAQVAGEQTISSALAGKALDRLEVDACGLDRTDRRVLQVIIEKFGGGPVGLETLAASVSEETDTIGDVYEPYLMQLGFINRTPRGRIVTPLGYEHLGIEPK